jgi:two-component system cell cycle sensor histidine kinase/response regulator CckA
MTKKPTYEELAQRIKELEKESIERKKAAESEGNKVAVETIEAMVDAVTIMELDGTIRQANSEFLRGTGWKKQEVLGKTPVELGIVSKEESQGIEKAIIPKLLKEGFVRNFETIVIRKDGTKFPALVSWTLIREAKGRPSGIISVAKDISERKRAEEALRESEQRYRTLADNFNFGITLIDTNYKIIIINAAHGRLYNKPASEFVGKNCFREFEKCEAVCPHCPGTRAMTTGHPAEVETEGVRDDGSRFPVRLQASPVFGSDGKVRGFIEVVEDITKRKLAEEEKKKLEAQLQHAQKMESLGGMAGGVAHNFRNILQAITGNNQFLQMAYSEDKQLQAITRAIEESGKRGSDLIDSLLKFSRQEVGIEMLPLDLRDVLSETYKIISNTFDTRIRIAVKIEGPLPIKGDLSNLAQVFMNLCNNARDSMPDGGELTIEARRDKGEVVVTISDTGCGMDEETLKNIFDNHLKGSS